MSGCSREGWTPAVPSTARLVVTPLTGLKPVRVLSEGFFSFCLDSVDKSLIFLLSCLSESLVHYSEE